MAAANEKKSGFQGFNVAMSVLAGLIFVYAISLFLQGAYNMALNNEIAAKIYAAELSDDVIAHQASQQALLDEGVRYLDEDNGVLCMPIEDAMARVVELQVVQNN